jgi:hypothetical protein
MEHIEDTVTLLQCSCCIWVGVYHMIATVSLSAEPILVSGCCIVAYFMVVVYIVRSRTKATELVS